MTTREERRAHVRALVQERRAAQPHLRAVEPAGPRAARSASIEWLGRRPLCELAPAGPVDRAELEALLAERNGGAAVEPVHDPAQPVEVVLPVRTRTHPLAWIALLVFVAFFAAALLRQHEDGREAPLPVEGMS